MDILVVLNRLNGLLTPAVSFAIVTLSVQHPFTNPLNTRWARLFVVPLTLYLMQLLYFTKDFHGDPLFWVAESMLLFLFLAADWKRAKALHGLAVPFLLLPSLTAGLGYLLHEQAAGVMKSVPQPHYFWSVLIPFALFYIRSRRRNRPLRFFFIGSLLLTLSYGVQFFASSLYMPEVSALLRITAYLFWLTHFTSIARDELLTCRQSLEQLNRRMEKTAFYAAKRTESELSRTHQSILENAKKDGLTGAFNRISIMDMIEDRIKRQPEQPFAILMFDIDRFKQINDDFGHVVGDLALKQLAASAERVIRSEDRLGRYGGDEFIILLPKLNLPEAKMVGERLKKKVQELSDPAFSISIGIAVYPKDGESVVQLIEGADQGLYKSKGKGGNAVSHVDVF